MADQLSAVVRSGHCRADGAGGQRGRRAAGRPVRLLTGYSIYQATDRGLLLTPVSQRTGPQADKLWNPDDQTVSQNFDAVLAASPAEIAWTPRCAATCHVQVLDLATGRQTAIELPAGIAEGRGVQSERALLALQVMSDRGGGPSTRVEVASTPSGR